MSQSIEAKEANFRQNLRSVAPFLYARYVQQFLVDEAPNLERAKTDMAYEQVFSASLQEQQEQLLALDNEIKQAITNLKKASMTVIQQLYSPELAAYRDLGMQAEELLKADFSSLLPETSRLSAETAAHVRHITKEFFKKRLEQIEALVEKGKKRNRCLVEVEECQKQLKKVLVQLKAFKDLASDRLCLEEKLQKISFSKQQLLQLAPTGIEGAIDALFLRYQECVSVLADTFSAINTHVLGAHFRCQEGKQTIQFRLFEIFFGISPYQDMAEDFSDLRQILNEKVAKLVDDFYSGVLSADEYLIQCQELAYEHDVIKIRNELAHRACRLKDIRDELLLLFRQMQLCRRFLEMIPDGVQEKVYGQVLFACRELLGLIVEVENPFASFAKAFSKDAVNRVYREFWIRIEALQQKIESIKPQVDHVLKTHSEPIKKRFLQTMDSLEEFLAGALTTNSVGKRPILVAQLEKDFQYVPANELWSALIEQMQAIEKRWSFVKPLSFFMSIHDFRLRLQLFQEAKELQEHMDATRAFAKTMQYIKTFEEERIDAILEGFEHHGLIEEEQSSDLVIQEAWKRYVQRQKIACQLIEEEVFIDVGLVDTHAIMDVDKAHLETILQMAVDRARAHMPTHMREGKEDLLETLRLFCHQLVDAKLFRASMQQSPLAEQFSIIARLRQVVDKAEKWVQEQRYQANPSWGHVWVAESAAIYHEITRFAMQAEEVEPLLSLISKVFLLISQIPEVKQAEADPLQLGVAKESLVEQVKKLSDFQKKKQLPFVYIPGYLHFFSHT